MKRRRTRNIGRESGECLCDMMDLLNWQPSTVIQVGVGRHYREIDALMERWGEFALHGFEPSPQNIEAVKGTYPGKLYNHAIGEKEETVPFYEKLRHANGATLHPRKGMEISKGTFQETTVDVKTLDGVFPNPSLLVGPILLWLDCEGSELNALRGGVNFLAWVSVVNVEVTAVPLYDEWCTMMEVHAWLVSCGFLRQGTHTETISAGQCDAIYVRHALWKPEHCYCPCSFTN